jgi:predicted  nucleic acid-binding Zn-ribbon protein
MRMIEDFKKDISNFLKEIQENTDKQIEALKEETKSRLKNYRKTKANRQTIEKTIQYRKIEIETIKKSQRETTLEFENSER